MGRESTEQCESDGDWASALGSSELRLALGGALHWAEASRPSNSLCLVIGWRMSRKSMALTQMLQRVPRALQLEAISSYSLWSDGTSPLKGRSQGHSFTAAP